MKNRYAFFSNQEDEQLERTVYHSKLSHGQIYINRQNPLFKKYFTKSRSIPNLHIPNVILF